MAENLQIFGNEYDGVNKIKVTNLEGTQVTFVKEPVLIEKNITSDGIFSAEDEGVDGYSVVNVDVTNINNVLGEKTVTKNNTTYHPFDDGLKGYSVVIVKIDDLIEKTITENGTYNASDDGVSGYSRVTVSGIGKVTGDDPDDSGDEVEASVDEQTGKVVIKKIPSSISITTKPTKLEYNEGDLMDYAGMVVKAFLKSGAVFTDETYPDGVIPDGELDKPVQVAHADGSGYDPTPGGEGGIYFVSDGSMTQVCTQLSDHEQINYVKIPAGIRYCGLYNGSGDFYVFAASEEPFKFDCYQKRSSDIEPKVETHEVAIAVNYNDKQYYYSAPDWSSPPPEPSIATLPWAGKALIIAGMDYLYGAEAQPYPGRQQIPVNWTSPYGKGETFTDSFTITVNLASDSEDDSSESHPE